MILLGVVAVVLVLGWGCACWLGWLWVVERLPGDHLLPGLLLAAVTFALWVLGSLVLCGLVGLSAA